MTSSKYLDSLGVSYLWNKIKNYTTNHTYSRATDGSNEIIADDNTHTIQIGGSGAITVALAEDGTSHNAKFTIGGTSETAASGGTALSMVTTGEKYTWNNKQNAITSSNKLSADLIEDGTTNKAYTATEKTKLAGIAAGAEVNQNAYSSITANGGVVHSAESKQSALDIYTSGNIQVSATPDGIELTVTEDFGKADKVTSATSGNLAALDEDGNLIDSGVNATTAGTDTKNTAGSTNDAAKLFIVGAKSQAANPQTYSQTNAYITAGKVYSNAKEVVNLSDTQALTNKTYNGYTLAAACAKAVDTSITSGSTSTNVPTTAAVEARITSAIQAAQSGAAMYQGAAPTTFAPTNYKSGYYWIVRTAGTYAGQTCEPGDMIFANTDSATYSASHFDVIQTNLDIASMTNSEIDAATDQTPNP